MEERRSLDQREREARIFITMKYRQDSMMRHGEFMDFEMDGKMLETICGDVARESDLDMAIGSTTADLVERTVLYTNSALEECAFLTYRHDMPDNARILAPEEFLRNVVDVIEPS